MSAPGKRGRPRAWGRAGASALVVLALSACSREEPARAPEQAPATSKQPEAAAATAQAAQPAGSAWFADVTQAWGVDFVHDAGLTPEKPLPETMGAGAALADVDNDGDLDLYLLQGGPMRVGGPEPGTFLRPPGELPVNRLYLNDGRGRFKDHTAASGAAADDGYAMGVAAGDVHGDGNVDLYVTNLGPDVLLRGDGTGAFSDATAAAGLSDGRWTSAPIFFDAEHDGDLDLYVAAYVLFDAAKPPFCGKAEPGWRSACHPDLFPGLHDRYWRNRGDGTFEDATQAAGLADNAGKGLGVLASDVDGDGHLDLYIANDSTENRLWMNRGDGTFRDGTLLSGTGVDGRGATEAGMGLASGDVDADGDLELLVTNFDDESDTLYFNDGAGIFEDRTDSAGLEAPTRLPVGFGVVLADFEHDGDLDLAVANGHIIDNIHLYHDGKTHAQLALLFENDGRGRFRELREEAGGLAARPLVGRGLYAGDLDGDLDLDLVVTQCGGPALLLRNDRARGHALLVEGLPPGTWLEAELEGGRKLLREAGPQPSYFGQCGPAAHFGLGERALQRLRVRVPGGDWKEVGLGGVERGGRLKLVLEGGLEGGKVRRDE